MTDVEHAPHRDSKKSDKPCGDAREVALICAQGVLYIIIEKGGGRGGIPGDDSRPFAIKLVIIIVKIGAFEG